MKILIIVMGILGLFASCTGRKERLAKKEDSTLNEFEVENNKSYLDTDTLGNIVNKGDYTIEVCTQMFNIPAFERHEKDFVDNCHEGYREILNDDTLRVYSKYINDNEVEFAIEEYSVDTN